MSARPIVLALALALSGCSAVNSMTSTVGGWFGAGPAKAKPAELVDFKPSASLSEAWKVETGDPRFGHVSLALSKQDADRLLTMM